MTMACGLPLSPSSNRLRPNPSGYSYNMQSIVLDGFIILVVMFAVFDIFGLAVGVIHRFLLCSPLFSHTTHFRICS